MGSDEEREELRRRRCARPADRARSCAISAFASTASSASTRRRARPTGRRIPAGNTKKIAETFRQACDVAEGLRRAARRRRRDLLGRHAQLEAQGRAARAGRTARRRSASRPTWRTRCSSRSATTRPRIASCPRATTGRTASTLDEALKTMTARAAAVDDRFPRRAERRHGQGLRLARQDRPALPAERSQRQARHRRATPATGCATTTGNVDASARSTSAGTAACSPTPR